MKSSGGRAQGTHSVYNTSGEGQLARGCFFNALFLPPLSVALRCGIHGRSLPLGESRLACASMNRMPSAPQRGLLG